MSEMIIVEDHDDVAVVRLAHGRVSALDIELCHALTNTFRTLASTKPIVLTGTGSVFSAGVDLCRIRDDGPAYIAEFLPAVDEAFLAVFETPRPVVAAINGHAIAGGCVLAAACDVRVMSAGTIGVTELPVGIPFPPAALEIVRYAFGSATDRLVLTGTTMDATSAHARGIVDEVTDPDQLLTRAIRHARALGAVPAPTYALTKSQLHRPATRLIEEGRALRDDAQVLATWRSSAAHTAVTEYLDRLTRRPGRRRREGAAV